MAHRSFLMDRFPPELKDRIIDYLQENRTALATCSLVSKDWVPSSRFHLFNRIALRPDNVQRLVELLDSPYSTVSQHTRRVHVSLKGNDDGEDIHTLACFAPCLPEFDIVGFYMTDFLWRPICDQHSENLSRSFSQITQLFLTSVSFLSISHVIEFITSFSSLKLFCIANSTLDPGPWDDPDFNIPSYHISPTLIALEILLHNDFQNALFRLISAAQYSGSSKTLLVDAVTHQDLRYLRALLQSLGPILNTLNITFEKQYLRAFFIILFEPMFNFFSKLSGTMST